MNTPKIVIVEDDPDVAGIIKKVLQDFAFQSLWSRSAGDLFKSLAESEILPDLCIIDLGLPDMDGIEAMQKLQQIHPDCGILILTGRAHISDRVMGLELGADDYMTKPFGVMEMLSRVKALLRRAKMGGVQEATEQVIRPALRVHEITLDEAKHRGSVQEGGEEIHPELTLKEFELLDYMMHNQELVLTRDQIMGQVWNYDYEGESRTIDMHVKTLRQKLGEAGQYIKTVRGVGYRLSAD